LSSCRQRCCIAQERGVEVELCKVDTAGGVVRVTAIAIPWQDLENEHRLG
jgi:hypothetical protein